MEEYEQGLVEDYMEHKVGVPLPTVQWITSYRDAACLSQVAMEEIKMSLVEDYMTWKVGREMRESVSLQQSIHHVRDC